jgi:hypothetical protein
MDDNFRQWLPTRRWTPIFAPTIRQPIHIANTAPKDRVRTIPNGHSVHRWGRRPAIPDTRTEP